MLSLAICMSVAVPQLMLFQMQFWFFIFPLSGTFQCELIRRLVREVLGTEHCALLLTGFLQLSSSAPAAWTDEQLAVIQTLVEAKVRSAYLACSLIHSYFLQSFVQGNSGYQCRFSCHRVWHLTLVKLCCVCILALLLCAVATYRCSSVVEQKYGANIVSEAAFAGRLIYISLCSNNYLLLYHLVSVCLYVKLFSCRFTWMQMAVLRWLCVLPINQFIRPRTWSLPSCSWLFSSAMAHR